MISKETEKHNQIVTAAAGLFARQGYKKTTIDEIVADSGISKGLFYHYFKNKKELYIYIYNTYADVLSRGIRDNVDITETDFFERLKQISYMRIDFVVQYPSLWGFLYSAYNEEHPDIAPLIKEKNATLLQSSYTSSAANIDWTKLRNGLSADQAIELITWVVEGFMRKITATNQTDHVAQYDQFEKYFEYLKFGMYEGGKE